MRKPACYALMAVATAGLAVLAPVSATADTGTTPATFTLTANASGLAISVPDGSVTPVNLGSTTAGSLSLSHALGDVTVTDTRGALAAAWTVTASTTNFTTGGATANETVAKANVGYFAGAGSAVSGQVGTFTPVGTALTPVPLAAATPVGAWAGVGNNTVTFNPTVTFTLLPSQVAGTYSGTITQSVS